MSRHLPNTCKDASSSSWEASCWDLRVLADRAASFYSLESLNSFWKLMPKSDGTGRCVFL
eukprot:1138028-Pelagomonas_calceolata.AAC.3